MNKLLANLNVMYVKLHNYHYNVVGNDFMQVHVALENEYDQFHEWIDEVAERIKQLGEFPLASLKDYAEAATIKEAESKEYRSKEVITDVINDYKTLDSDIEEIKKNTDDITISILEDIQVELQKKIWLLSSIVK